MSASALPQELIDGIIDIAGDDFQSLKALGLVGPQWTWRTRKHLFQKIELREISSHPLDPTTRCKQLLELFKLNRELCVHARSLVIHSSTADPDAEETDRNLGWLQVCSEEVIRVIEMLQGVTAASLLKGEREMNFSHLSSPLSAALQSFVSRPSITELTLYGVRSMEITPLVQHSSVEHLFMAFTYPPKAEILRPNANREQQPSTTTAAPLSGSAPSRKFLRTLDVFGAGTALRLLLFASLRNPQSTIDFTQVTSVTVGSIMEWDRNMAGIWPEFLRLCCKIVQDYCVRPGPWMSMPSASRTRLRPEAFNPVVYSFAQLPKLVNLKIEIPHYHVYSSRFSPLPHLLAALQTLGSSHKPVPLKCLTLEFNFGSIQDETNVTKRLAEISKIRVFWGCLDETLSRGQVFSHFIHVTVLMNLSMFCRFNQSIEELDELKNGMLSYMPNLGGQSKVKIVFHLPS
jgi:hypothetical protein